MQLCDYLSYKLPPDESIWLIENPAFTELGRRFDGPDSIPDENAILFCGDATGKRQDKQGNAPVLSQCLEECERRPDCRYIVIAGKSAVPVTKSIAGKLPPNVLRMYATNVEVDDSRIRAMPLGRDFRARRAFESLTFTCSPADQRALCYCNFSLNTSRERHRVFRRLRRRKWITFEHMGEWQNYSLTHEEYLQRVSQHRFTVSPEGIGRDCYRTWDALYMKSIPVVANSISMRHFADLPILFTRSYRELTPRYLERKYRKMLDTDYNIEKLRWSYWEGLIRADAREIGVE